MAYQVLARKWRPRLFSDVIGQDHVVKTLTNAIEHNRIGHAYLLTGTRGVGKTSIARIFAKALTCLDLQNGHEPCLKCSSCLSVDQGSSINVLEIDGASHNSVEDVRILMEGVNFVPSQGRFKVYIIDEVHMLTVNAFNALLKTLEEPPEHVVFIFATTDPQKLIGTVLSRFQRLDCRSFGHELLKEQLTTIAKKENISVAPGQADKVFSMLAELGRGSSRDALSLFDQVLGLSGGAPLDEKMVAQALGLLSQDHAQLMVRALLHGEVEKLSENFKSLLLENIDVIEIARGMLNFLFKQIQGRQPFENFPLSEIMWVYENFIRDLEWASKSFDPEQTIMVVLQKLALRRQLFQHNENHTEIQVTEKKNLIIEPTTPLLELHSEIIEIIEIEEIEISAPELEAEVVLEVEPMPKATVLSWEDMIEFLRVGTPVGAANLEQGNLLEPIGTLGPNDVVNLRIGFSAESQVFLEYLNDREVSDKLIKNIASYFSREVDKIHLRLELIDNKTKESMNFMSMAQLAEKSQEEIRQEKIISMSNHPLIKEAERMFGSKLDKVVLNL